MDFLGVAIPLGRLTPTSSVLRVGGARWCNPSRKRVRAPYHCLRPPWVPSTLLPLLYTPAPLWAFRIGHASPKHQQQRQRRPRHSRKKDFVFRAFWERDECHGLLDKLRVEADELRAKAEAQAEEGRDDALSALASPTVNGGAVEGLEAGSRCWDGQPGGRLHRIVSARKERGVGQCLLRACLCETRYACCCLRRPLVLVRVRCLSMHPGRR